MTTSYRTLTMRLYRFAISVDGGDDLYTLGLITARNDEQAFMLGCDAFAPKHTASKMAGKILHEPSRQPHAYYTVVEIAVDPDVEELLDECQANYRPSVHAKSR